MSSNLGSVRTGAVVVWHSAEAHVERLRDGFKMLNLERYTPAGRSKYTAMLEAVKKYHSGRQFIVRPLEGRKGFEVTEEIKGSDMNEHKHVVSYIFLGDDSVTNSPYDQSQLDGLLAIYAEKIGLCSPKDLTSAVADVIVKDLRGLCLKDGGAVYWVAGECIPKLFDVEKAVCAAAPSFQLSVFRHEMTDREKASVVVAATREMKERATKITEDVTSGDLKECALRNRERECEGLMELAKFYESELAISLQEVIDAIESTKVAASAAAIMMSASN